MEFDKLQQTWQKQSPADQVKVGGEQLLQIVRRNHQAMEKSYFVQDRLIAVVFGAIYVPIWIWTGMKYSLPWTWYLEIPAFLLVAAFLIRNRITQRKMRPQPGESLRESVDRSLTRVDHQIRLQKNVFLWYLLPPWLPMAAFFIHTGILQRSPWAAANNIIVSILIFWGIYELFQGSVRKHLIPHRDELQNFLKSIDEEN